jgi:hypothetical protein
MKGNRENVPGIKDINGLIIKDATEKANTFNSYYLTVFSNEDNFIHIQGGNIGEPFTTDVKIIRRKIKAICENKPVGPDRVSEEILNP